MSNIKEQFECSAMAPSDESDFRPSRTGPPPLPESCTNNDQSIEAPPIIADISNELLRGLVVALTAVAVLLSTSILIALSQNQESTGLRSSLETVPVGNRSSDLTLALASDQIGACVVDSESLTGTLKSEPRLQSDLESPEIADEDQLPTNEPALANRPEDESSEEQDPILAFDLPEVVEEGKVDDRPKEARPGEESQVLIVTNSGREAQTSSEEKANETVESTAVATTCEPGGIDSNSPEVAPKKQKCLPISAPYYGTKIKWHRKVDDAAKLAKTENKPVFLIHVSGNFTKEEFT